MPIYRHMPNIYVVGQNCNQKATSDLKLEGQTGKSKKPSPEHLPWLRKLPASVEHCFDHVETEADHLRAPGRQTQWLNDRMQGGHCYRVAQVPLAVAGRLGSPRMLTGKHAAT